jgi:hypothetical protein
MALSSTILAINRVPYVLPRAMIQDDTLSFTATTTPSDDSRQDSPQTTTERSLNLTLSTAVETLPRTAITLLLTINAQLQLAYRTAAGEEKLPEKPAFGGLPLPKGLPTRSFFDAFLPYFVPNVFGYAGIHGVIGAAKLSSYRSTIDRQGFLTVEIGLTELLTPKTGEAVKTIYTDGAAVYASGG